MYMYSIGLLMVCVLVQLYSIVADNLCPLINVVATTDARNKPLVIIPVKMSALKHTMYNFIILTFI